jgi:hypothetical protein
VQNCKNLRKIAEKMQRFAKIRKKLQKKYAFLHNFSPHAALLIENLPPFNLSILPKRLQLIRPLATE